jgi:hypothetical protein
LPQPVGLMHLEVKTYRSHCLLILLVLLPEIATRLDFYVRAFIYLMFVSRILPLDSLIVI